MMTNFKKTLHSKKTSDIPGLSSIASESEGKTCKTLYRSISLSSLSTSTLKSFTYENDTGDKEYEEKYELEYSYYLLRKLQSKMLSEDQKREEGAKKCLVSLKIEYENLLEKNVQLYEEIKKIEGFAKCIEVLENSLSEARRALEVLRENEFHLVLKKLALHFECSSSQLQLIDLKKTDIDDAFNKNVLGFESDLYKLLKKMQDYVAEHSGIIPEIVAEIREIQNLHEENEKLKKRCMAIGNKLQSQSIRSNYKKCFNMAKEECKDLIMHGEQEETIDKSLYNSSVLGKPNSSSSLSS